MKKKEREWAAWEFSVWAITVMLAYWFLLALILYRLFG